MIVEKILRRMPMPMTAKVVKVKSQIMKVVQTDDPRSRLHQLCCT